MAIYKEDFVDIELTTGTIYRTFLKKSIGEGDKLANRFGIRALRNGAEESLGGSCTGYFIRSTGDTVVIEGTVSGARAYVDLPQACYAYEGQFSLAIKVTSGTATGTMRIIDGVVSNTTTGSVIDPGTIVPSIDDLIDAIETAVASIPADYSAMWETFAPEFSNETAYSYGQYVTYDGGLYRFIEDHPAGSWDGNHALPVTAGGELENGNNALDALTGCVPIRLVPGKYITLSGDTVTMDNGVPAISGNSFSNYAVGVMACEAGDVFTISGHGGSDTRLWGFIDDAGNVLSVASASATENGLVLVAPEDAAFIIIHTNDRKVSYQGYDKAKQFLNNTVDVLDYFKKRSVSTSQNVTFTWDGNVCTVDGTAQGNTWNYMVTYNDPMLPLIVPGEKYQVHFKQGGGGNVAFGIIWKLSDDTLVREYYYFDEKIVVPDTAISATIGLVVRKGMTADEETIEVSLYNMTGAAETIGEQLDELTESLADYLPRNVLKDFGTFETSTSHDVTFSWQTDKETCIVNGTADGTAYNFIWNYNDGLPASIAPGNMYDLKFDASTEQTVAAHLYYLIYDDTTGETDVTGARYFKDATITVPEDCIGISIRLDVSENVVCDNVVAKIELKTRQASAAQGGVANHVSKMFSVGSSFMTGWIYINQHKDHECEYDDTPYGNIATGLGIEQRNVTHIIMPSTGLLYAANPERGSCLDKILETDISKYDYVLTEVNRPDLGTSASVPGYYLGDLTSEAGDGTIVGAVKTLLNYMKTNAPNATLILVGAPPSATSDEYAYQNVFTANYYKGYSIHDCNIMLHRLAVQKHFIFIDWEDLNLSYYYKDLCDNNVHPFADATCRTMGLYLARQCNYTTSLLKVMKADAEGQ